MFRKLLLSMAAIATVSTALIASTASAEARGWHRHWGHHGVYFNIGRPIYRPVFWRANCHATQIRFHHHWHRARVCNGRIVKVF